MPEKHIMKRFHGKSGITLIEMLAVILIIGILGAILLPAVQNARRRSHETKAYSEIKQLKNAWRAYVSTYMNDSRVGSFTTATVMGPDEVEILQGLDTDANPDRIKFMDFPVIATNGFRDPWGTEYHFSIEPLQSKSKTWMYSTRVYCANHDLLD